MALDLDSLLTSAPPTSTFRVALDEGSDATVLALQGEADVATAPELSQALAQVSRDAAARVVLDVTSLKFIDAYCLGVIADTRTVLRDRGGELVIRAPSTFFRRVLTLLEMEDLIER